MVPDQVDMNEDVCYNCATFDVESISFSCILTTDLTHIYSALEYAPHIQRSTMV
jgi:hypothetical protein